MLKILVIGESCLDQFVYCDTTRLAPDVPVPVLTKRYRQENPGMAANVQRNILALGVQCELTTQPNWRDTTKTRYVHESSNHTFIRVDDKDRVAPFAFLHQILRIIQDFDAVAISDYDKGFLSADDIAHIANAHPLTFLDTKKILCHQFSRCRYIKINLPEFQASRRVIEFNPYLAAKVIVTAGRDGAHFKNKQYPVERVATGDVSGAGDTFFAALVVKTVQTGDVDQAITFANVCASQVVRDRGVSIPKGQ